MKTKLSVVTFNLRMDNHFDGQNYFFNRSSHILDTIVEKKPDIICFQEATPPILEWLKNSLEAYTVVGCGRNADFTGEANPIAFLKDKFKLFSLDQFWLSPTPHKAGSRYKTQSNCPRICMTAVLRVKGSARLVRIYNTHLDHVSERARAFGMGRILTKIGEDDRLCDAPKLLFGDMNALPTEDCIMAALKSGLTDLTESVAHSFHDFGRQKGNKKIDYIFGGDRCELRAVRVWDMQWEGIYLSDHYPIECEVELG